jgi:dolichol kinase
MVLLVVPLFGGVAVLRWVLAGGALLACAIDVLRLLSPSFRSGIERILPVFRPHESRCLSGATWLAMGYALAAQLPWFAARSGILVGGLADPAASLVGGRWGRGTGTAKTTVGSAALFVVAFSVLAASGVPVLAASVSAVAATLVERIAGPVDDNLIVPTAAALMVLLLT